MPVVALPCRGHHGSPILQIQWVGEVRLPDFAVLVSCAVRSLRPRLLIPRRQRMILVVGHQPNPERLVVGACCTQSLIENPPMDFALFRPDRLPEPAAIGK